MANIWKPTLLVGAALLIAFAIYADVSVTQCEAHTTDDLTALPNDSACLVLGTSPQLRDGRVNQYFQFRMAAAAQAYAAHKCRKLVVSGDNRHKDYNEPEAMKAALITLGVPTEVIVCDYAGGRTLDSVLRFKAIFGQTQGIVISQKFHNARAIYIARYNQLQLTGYNAAEVDAYSGLRTRIREKFSRMRAVVDVRLLSSQPRHLGNAIAL